MILEEKPSVMLETFLNEYSKFAPFDRMIVDANIKYIENNLTRTIEHRWYASLDAWKPDFSVYEDPYYFVDLWVCWQHYSRQYLKTLAPVIAEMKSESILDLGCGLGFTTASLKEISPKSVVYGLDFAGSYRYEFCEALGLQYGFQMRSSLNSIYQEIDTVFASEYFEHIETPIEHLEDIVSKFRPQNFIIANSFNTQAIGHFRLYRHNGVVIPQAGISRLFNNRLRELGYAKMPLKIWNGKPSVWRRV